jgi:hypothetical protein
MAYADMYHSNKEVPENTQEKTSEEDHTETYNLSSDVPYDLHGAPQTKTDLRDSDQAAEADRAIGQPPYQTPNSPSNSHTIPRLG